MRQSRAMCGWIATLAATVLLPVGTAGWAQAPRYDNGTFYAAAAPLHLLQDIDGDGRLDVVAAGVATPWVEVWLGDDSGRFHLGPIAPGGFCIALDAGELNGSGLADLVCEIEGDTVKVVLSTSDGTYDPYFLLHGAQLGGDVEIRDCNGDGHLDIAEGAGGWLGDGTGGFAPAGSCLPLVGLPGDVNGDGIPDLVDVWEVFLSWSLTVRLGLPDGGFGPVLYGPDVPAHARPLAVGDLSGDCHSDVLLASPTHLMLSLGVGNGAFTPPVPSSFGGVFYWWAAEVGEFGSQWPEAAVLDRVTGEARFFSSTAAGVLSQVFSFPLPDLNPIGGLLVGDLNRDGIDDLVISESSGFRVYLSRRSVLEVPALSPVGLAALVCGLALCALLLLRGRVASRG